MIRFLRKAHADATSSARFSLVRPPVGHAARFAPRCTPCSLGPAATTPARLSIEPHDPEPQIPRPTQAHSTYLPETYVNTTWQQFGATHTLTNFFDGSFNTPLIPTFSPGTTYTATPGNPVELDLPYTGRDHDLLTFNIHMTGTTFLANAMVAVQEVSGTWTNPTSVMSLTRSPTSNTRENVRLSLGVVPRGAPLRIRFSCEHTN